MELLRCVICNVNALETLLQFVVEKRGDHALACVAYVVHHLNCLQELFMLDVVDDSLVGLVRVSLFEGALGRVSHFDNFLHLSHAFLGEAFHRGAGTVVQALFPETLRVAPNESLDFGVADIGDLPVFGWQALQLTFWPQIGFRARFLQDRLIVNLNVALWAFSNAGKNIWLSSAHSALLTLRKLAESGLILVICRHFCVVIRRVS